jgi:colanic acid biosynthesis protein WcaH
MTQNDISISGTSTQLPAEDFKHVIKNAPLISIDLIVKDGAGRFLLGLRTNAPAKGYWFVPGGRVYKNERLEEALNRISLAELGRELTLDDCRFLGMYEHFYEDNAFSEEFGTHYVVTAFSPQIESLESLPDIQHSDYRWLSSEEILGDPNVHAHTKDYFLPSKGVR